MAAKSPAEANLVEIITNYLLDNQYEGITEILPLSLVSGHGLWAIGLDNRRFKITIEEIAAGSTGASPSG